MFWRRKNLPADIFSGWGWRRYCWLWYRGGSFFLPIISSILERCLLEFWGVRWFSISGMNEICNRLSGWGILGFFSRGILQLAGRNLLRRWSNLRARGRGTWDLQASYLSFSAKFCRSKFPKEPSWRPNRYSPERGQSSCYTITLYFSSWQGWGWPKFFSRRGRWAYLCQRPIYSYQRVPDVQVSWWRGWRLYSILHQF